ncbi:MAG: hypothetical protein ACREAM_03530 [Blastocatellia bacterium]
MSLVLLIPDGVGVRNFLIGPFLRLACENWPTHVFHHIPEDRLAAYANGLGENVRWREFDAYRETPVSATLRYSLGYAHMNWGDTQAMRDLRSRPVNGSWRRRAVQYAARLTGRVAATRHGIKTLDRLLCRAAGRQPEVERYRRVLRQINPQALFCSHQRPPVILPLVLAARSLGIPTATFIFSWDNLTSKGRIAAPFDHYLVWSEHMRGELLRFYPDVSTERVHVVGTPQFDPYADQSLLWPREEFFARIGADPSRPLLCYSGGDAGTAPEDHLHIRTLMELIREGRVKNNPRVILRPTPVDDGSRYEPVQRDFPEMIYARPDWVHTTPGEWSRVIPSPDDARFLANLTHHADVNVNLASTMTLDFAIHDRPVVNIAFDIADPPPFGKPLWDFYYRFEHYQPVVKIGAARFARSRDELAEHINAYLDDPSLDREARRQLVSLEVGVPIGQSSQRIIEVLKKTISDWRRDK